LLAPAALGSGGVTAAGGTTHAGRVLHCAHKQPNGRGAGMPTRAGRSC
jgi:hypothetical protein